MLKQRKIQVWSPISSINRKIPWLGLKQKRKSKNTEFCWSRNSNRVCRKSTAILSLESKSWLRRIKMISSESSKSGTWSGRRKRKDSERRLKIRRTNNCETLKRNLRAKKNKNLKTFRLNLTNKSNSTNKSLTWNCRRKRKKYNFNTSELETRSSRVNRKGTILKLQNSKKSKNITSRARNLTWSAFKTKKEKFKANTSCVLTSLDAKPIASLNSKSVFYKIKSTVNFKRWNAPKNAVTNNSSSS